MSRIRVILLVALIFVAIPILLSAQGEKRDKANSDLGLAEGLVNRGWLDWADEIIVEVKKKGNLSADDNIQLTFISASVYSQQANTEADPAKQSELLSKALGELEKFIKANPNSSRLADAILKAGRILLNRGESISKKIKEEADPKKVSDLRATAIESFKSAYKRFDDAVKFIGERAKEKRIAAEEYKYTNNLTDDDPKVKALKEEADRIAFDQMDAEYDRARTLYYQSLLYESNSGERKEVLEKAIKEFADFRLNWDRIQIFNAAIIQGMCYRDIGDFKKAIEAFDGAIGIKDAANADGKPIFKSGNKYDFSQSSEVQDIVARGYYFKAETHFQNEKDNKKTIDTIDELYKVIPNIFDNIIGKGAQLLKARALRAMKNDKDIATAKEIARKVRDSLPEGHPMREDAEREMAGAVEGGASSSASDLLLSVRRKIRDKEYDVAVEIAKKALQDLKGKPEEEKQSPEFYYQIARAYQMNGESLSEDSEKLGEAGKDAESKSRMSQTLSKYKEAMQYFEIVYTKYTKHELAPDAVANAIRCAKLISSASGSTPADKVAYEKALEFANRNFPDNPKIDIVPYLLAEEFERQGKFLEAAQKYELVKEKSAVYETALVKVGYCYRMYAFNLDKQKKHQEAVSYYKKSAGALEKFLGFARKLPMPTESDKAEYRRDLMFKSYDMVCKTYMMKELRDPKKVIDLLANIGNELAAEPKNVLTLSQYKVTASASLANDQLSEAESTVENILDTLKKNPSQDVAESYKKAANSASIASDRLGEAVSVLEGIVSKDPSISGISNSYRDIASGYDRLSENLIRQDKEGKLKDKITANQKMAVKYYHSWLEKAFISTDKLDVEREIIAAGDRLFMIGLRLNNIPIPSDNEDVTFVGRDTSKFAEKEAWETAANNAYKFALGEAERQNIKLVDKSNGQNIEWKVRLKIARCYGFLGKFDDCRTELENVISENKLINKDEKIDRDVVKQKQGILGVYEELGYACMATISTNAFAADKALKVFGNLFDMYEKEGRGWWEAKYYFAYILYMRGKANDFDVALATISNAERTYPEFDKNKFGVKDKFLKLKKDIQESMPKK